MYVCTVLYIAQCFYAYKNICFPIFFYVYIWIFDYIYYWDWYVNKFEVVYVCTCILGIYMYTVMSCMKIKTC